jgi:hypothetical protein
MRYNDVINFLRVSHAGSADVNNLLADKVCKGIAAIKQEFGKEERDERAKYYRTRRATRSGLQAPESQTRL